MSARANDGSGWEERIRGGVSEQGGGDLDSLFHGLIRQSCAVISPAEMDALTSQAELLNVAPSPQLRAWRKSKTFVFIPVCFLHALVGLDYLIKGRWRVILLYLCMADCQSLSSKSWQARRWASACICARLVMATSTARGSISVALLVETRPVC